MKKIDELQEISSQATESTDALKSEVQSLRLSLYEAFAMSAEAQSKVESLNNSRWVLSRIKLTKCPYKNNNKGFFLFNYVALTAGRKTI